MKTAIEKNKTSQYANIKGKQQQQQKTLEFSIYFQYIFFYQNILGAS